MTTSSSNRRITPESRPFGCGIWGSRLRSRCGTRHAPASLGAPALDAGAWITLAPEFNFLGFGGAGASVGQYDFDSTHPNNHSFDPIGHTGLFDYRIPHVAIDANTAYADSLQPGVVQLPSVTGSCNVMRTATSVDPDTGDANDHPGKPPIVYQRTIPVWVPEPDASALGLAAIPPRAALARRRTTPRAH